MKIIIDVPIYDELRAYSKSINEPISVIATKAIKEYLKNME